MTSIFDVNGWTCEPIARKGRHVFTKPGQTDIVVTSNGWWHPGMPDVDYGTLVPRGWNVARTARERVAGVKMVGQPDANFNGVIASGWDIILDPFGQPYSLAVQQEADRIMQRQPIAAFDWFTGEPLDPEVNGSEEYALGEDQALDTNAERTTQLRAFKRPTPITHPQAGWHRIAASHYCRYSWRNACSFFNTGDPAAWMGLVCGSWEVMRSYRLTPLGNDPFKTSMGQMLVNVTAQPHTGQMGITRWRAHSISQVAYTRAFLDHPMLSDWLRTAIHVECTGQCANGMPGDNHYGQQHEQEQPWTIPKAGYSVLPTTAGEFPTFQGPYMACALDAAATALKEPDINRMVDAWLRKYVDAYRTTRPEAGDLPYWIVTSDNGAQYPNCTWGIGHADPTWVPDLQRVCLKRGIEIPRYEG